MVCTLGLEPGVNRLVDHDPRWALEFETQAARIRDAAGPLALGVEHIGSTAVAGLKAKPVIDILVGVREIDDGLKLREPMARLGYDYAGDQGITEHHVFGLDAKRTHLVHVVVHEADQWRALIAFRDRLRADRALRADYAALKADLAARSGSRAAYTRGKAAFVQANSGEDSGTGPKPPAPTDPPAHDREPDHTWTEEEIDEAIEESFPASDPPAFPKID